MLDKEKLIAAESVVSSIASTLTNIEKDDVWAGKMTYRFNHCIKLAEDYATLEPEEEYINTGVRVPKAYWDTRDQTIIGPDNRPQKTESGWFIFTQKKNIFEFKKLMDERETQ